MRTVNVLVDEIVSWVNRERIECFYPGIWADCAMSLRIAPNSEVFYAAMNLVEFVPGDYRNETMTAYVPYDMQ